MSAVFVCVLFWFLSIIGETILTSALDWFSPNLFFLFPTILGLRWRGYETIYISTFFGVTADCFSTLPFGVFGLAFMLISLFTRWYSNKVFQSTTFTLPFITGFLSLVLNILVLVLLYMLAEARSVSFSWVRNLIIYQVFTTALLSIPCYWLLIWLEQKYKIRLAERKF